MDGTVSGYYFEPATTSESQTKYVIHLQGGGECASKQACDTNVNSKRGSSKYFAPNMTLWFFNAPDPKNPLLDWNHIHVPYCSQDLHSGTVTQPSNETYGYFFSGHLVFQAVVAELTELHGFGQATEVVLSGASAGGIGTWVNVGYLQSVLPEARVTVVPIAGFYFYAYPYTGPDATPSNLANFSQQGMVHNVALWDSHMNADCIAAFRSLNQSSGCLLANNSYPFVDVPLFIIEAQTDQVVTMYHDYLPSPPWSLPEETQYLQQWSHNMTSALDAVIAKKGEEGVGIFNPACFTHTGFSSSSPKINNMSYYDAFRQWYFDGKPTILMDDCGILCNPTCAPPA
jgi:hypothetical protein